MQRLIDAAGVRGQSAADVLAGVVLPQIDRARALIDLNPLSQTFGCADRSYWYYRTLTNFPGATWQQLMLAFACVYRSAHPANPHHLDPQPAALTGGLLSFWAKSQHKDGAFDEWYLNEHSYCPTAITGAGAALTLHLMGDAIPAEARAAGIGALERAGRWLEPRYNAEVMNQNLAAAVALHGLARLFPGSRWSAVARARLDRIRGDQKAEGWFPEYGGMDLGYSSLALDLLAACRLLGADTIAADMAAGLCRFLRASAGAGFAPPGRLGSRGTSHAFPFGAMLFSAGDPNAAAVAEGQLRGLARELVPRPENVDDRYFAYFYLPQFALALHQSSGPLSLNAAQPGNGVSDLPESGLAVVRRAAWSLSASRRLGGAVAMETPESRPLYHLGYEVTTADGRRFSSATLSAETPAPCVDGQPIATSAHFRAVSSGLPLRRLMVPFQVIAYLLRSSSAASAFQSLIKRRMISPRATLPLRLERTVAAGEDSARVIDTLVPEPGLARLVQVQVAPAVAMHSPSARQESGTALALAQADAQRVLAQLNAGAAATMVFVLDPKSSRKEVLDVHFHAGSHGA